jgi:hypothetical protein
LLRTAWYFASWVTFDAARRLLAAAESTVLSDTLADLPVKVDPVAREVAAVCRVER